LDDCEDEVCKLAEKRRLWGNDMLDREASEERDSKVPVRLGAFGVQVPLAGGQDVESEADWKKLERWVLSCDKNDMKLLPPLLPGLWSLLLVLGLVGMYFNQLRLL
jgi:hypothetical protein